jgi:hypothetical protein
LANQNAEAKFLTKAHIFFLRSLWGLFLLLGSWGLGSLGSTGSWGSSGGWSSSTGSWSRSQVGDQAQDVNAGQSAGEETWPVWGSFVFGSLQDGADFITLL